MASIGADLVFAPFRGPDSNQNTDINAGDYHILDSVADIAAFTHFTSVFSVLHVLKEC